MQYLASTSKARVTFVQMADTVISLVGKVAEYFVTPVLRSATRHARFLFCVGKIKRNLENVKAELISKQESVKKQKHEALIRTEIIEEAVEKWLNEVTSVMEEVEKLEQEMKEGSSCCWGWCSTLKGYHLSKQFAKITETMKSQSQKGEFNPFSHPAMIPDIEFFSSENFVCFESTKSASNQLLEALRDDSVRMIGLHGMGGCGKTTLAKEVGKKAKELKLFDHVLFTVVSQSVNVKKIQDEIAGLLELNFKNDPDNVRARKLSLQLQNGKKHLIILDDVWSCLNLAEDIGIPLNNNCKGCKVLLTTRLQQVCAHMDCEKKIQLDLLSYEEANCLFQKNTPIVDEFVAQEIVRECKGLPIAIVAVAKSLKGRSLDWWKVALHKLRTSKPIDVEENEKDAYSCLELSYNSLRRNEARLLLKICCMFPEDHKIRLEELFRYGIGLGMCEGEDSFDLARSTMNTVVKYLIDSSLLLSCQSENNGEEKCFNIHDVVRDVTLWIASKEHNTIMVNPERGFSAIAENRSLKDCYAVSLWHKGIDQFPQHLDAPKLRFLLLNLLHDQHLDISDASFEGMKELKLMSLLHNHEFLAHRHAILSLPSSTQWKCFNNLHTLRLINQKIGDISFVKCLRRLKILDLAGSVFKKLPNVNCELKLMDLSDCKIEEEEDCSEVIGRCSKLQELYMPPKIALPYECFVRSTFPKLQRYLLNIYNHNFENYDDFLFNYAREFRVVSIGNMNISNLCPTVGDLLKRASLVRVDGLVGGCRNIIPDFVQAFGSTNELTKLYLCSCSEIECLIDTTTFDEVDAKFPMLVKSALHNMGNLKEVIRGPPSLRCAFEKLEYLSVEDCPNLTSLFPSSVAQFLPQLEYLNVRNCYELKHIIVKEENGINADEMEIFPNLKRINISLCHDLEYIFLISVARTLLSVEYIWICGCRQLKDIIVKEENGINADEMEIFPNLEHIYIDGCRQLKYIIKNEGEGATTTHIMRKNEERPNQSCFSKLRELTVVDCNELKSLFSLSNAAHLSQLEILRVSFAAQLEQAFGYKNKDVNYNTDKIMLPNLSQLRLEMLPNFVDICPGLKVHVAKLRHMTVVKCPMFDSIHRRSTQAQVINDRQVCNEVTYLDGSSFEEEQENIITPNLKWLNLEDLPYLMFIWKGDTLINFQNLVHLLVDACGKLKFIFPACAVRSLPPLKSLRIRDCEELEQIFGYGSEKHDYDGKVIELALPNLIYLELFCLPRFTSFGGDLEFQLKFQALKRYKVLDCPKLSSTTLAILENFLPSHNSGDNYLNNLLDLLLTFDGTLP